MRIAMIGQKGLPATYGGIERHVEEIGRRLVAAGHDVSAFCRLYYTPAGAQYHGLRLLRRPSIITTVDHSATRIPLIGMWKMADNLRRTLSAPAAWLTLVAGWTLPHSRPLVWTAFVLVTIALPALVPPFAEVIPQRSGISKRTHLRSVGGSFNSPAIISW